ncbi:S-layer homology domain-containing protein [Paenibacillus agricola]|uniref:S-layer homology domain-containing protein n=1 Tax=Paenibacillus agricola TaxID=2716264 RepID=A0ABX0JDT7_9BACL|nr:S-layer homology domain-containing protein [Paenibacillus agricola]NHN34292.1 S-layer homology domain-containing protein [Paenibacillus agricola]
MSKFDAYVERTIAIPDGVDPSKITTGVVVEPDGTVRHVPTRIVMIDGKYYAKVNSLTNSTYSIVWHPLEFNDIAQHWAKDIVNDMGSRMIVSGVGNSLFNPDQDITRAEFAAIMTRGLGLKLENGVAPFMDVKATDWYSSAVHTAYTYSLLSGFEDGTFRPMDKITREQAMAIIAKAMKITDLKAKQTSKEAGALLSSFADANNASEWAKSSIAECLQAGIVSGRNSTQLAPKASITRAEVAAIIQRLLQKSELI